MAPISWLLKRALALPFVSIGLYVFFLALMTNPWLQRNALYAHNVHTGFMHNISEPSRWGFASGQVLPFNITTPDNETLFAWHVLPLNTYAEHEFRLAMNPPSKDMFTSLIRENPRARVVINLHGNAGHVAQGWRTDTYLRLSSLPDTHVITFDYRGFGLSTGSPDERGLITDAVTLVEHVMHTTGIDPSRIVILGQSLGTAVASAISLHYADPDSTLLPSLHISPSLPAQPKRPLVFAGTVLVAPFSSLSSLLLTYRIGGLLPVLSPLAPYPFLHQTMGGYILDKWDTLSRLVAYRNILAHNSDIRAGRAHGLERGSLQILHAINDRDISFEQSRLLWAALSGREVFVDEKSKGVRDELDGREEEKPRVGVQFLEFGGHNRIVTFAPVALAVLRAFKGE